MKVSGRKSVTIIELIVVVVIIGALAAVSAPLIRRHRWTAMSREALMMMGHIKTMEHVYFGKTGTYLAIPMAGQPFRTEALNTLGINVNDLNGLYFDNTMFFALTAGPPIDLLILCDPNKGTVAPRRAETTQAIAAIIFRIDGFINITYRDGTSEIR